MLTLSAAELQASFAQLYPDDSLYSDLSAACPGLDLPVLSDASPQQLSAVCVSLGTLVAQLQHARMGSSEGMSLARKLQSWIKHATHTNSGSRGLRLVDRQATTI